MNKAGIRSLEQKYKKIAKPETGIYIAVDDNGTWTIDGVETTPEKMEELEKAGHKVIRVNADGFGAL